MIFSKKRLPGLPAQPFCFPAGNTQKFLKKIFFNLLTFLV